jgi:hypothetical protein
MSASSLFADDARSVFELALHVRDVSGQAGVHPAQNGVPGRRNRTRFGAGSRAGRRTQKLSRSARDSGSNPWRW